MRKTLWNVLIALVASAGARAAVVPAPGFAVRTYPTPGVAVGGVARSGNAIFVGQGAFGAGTQSIVRLDGAIATTVAAGFNSLGGFDVGGTTLYAVDNCFGADFGCTGAATGDTVYAVGDATTRGTAVAAAAAALLPSGSIPAAQDVLVAAGALFVSDAVGVGAGRVVEIVGSTPSTFATGLDYLGGLATDGTTLFVGNLDAGFAGSVRRYVLATGAPLTPLASGLSGSYGVARDGAGSVLVTGGFTGDFSSSTLVALDGAGTPAEWAHGFSFSGDVFYDAPRGAALVLDFGVAAVTAVCRDANGDAVCDADCGTPGTIARTKLTIGRQVTGPGDDTLKLKGQMGVASTAPIDPVTTGARVLVDDAGGRVVVDVLLPGGAYDPVTRAGWRGRGASWTFRHPTGVGGITVLKAKQSAVDPRLVKISVTGKNGGFDAASAALPLHAVVALSPADQCGVATFAGPDAGCAVRAGGATVLCR